MRYVVLLVLALAGCSEEEDACTICRNGSQDGYVACAGEARRCEDAHYACMKRCGEVNGPSFEAFLVCRASCRPWPEECESAADDCRKTWSEYGALCPCGG